MLLLLMLQSDTTIVISRALTVRVCVEITTTYANLRFGNSEVLRNLYMLYINVTNFVTTVVNYVHC